LLLKNPDYAQNPSMSESPLIANHREAKRKSARTPGGPYIAMSLAINRQEPQVLDSSSPCNF